MTIIKDEAAGAVLGVPGRYSSVVRWPADAENKDGTPARHAGRIAGQSWMSDKRPVEGFGAGGLMCVELRLDDACKNGHESFAITASVTTTKSRQHHDIAAGGCLHDEIAQHFPELAPLVRWHLVGIRGPMHYEANTIYLAGNRDHNGLRLGQSRQIIGKAGPMWERVLVDAQGVPVERSGSALHCGEKPADQDGLRMVWRACMRVGEGKARELDKARSAACWPEASDEQLRLPRDELRALLRARLPALMVEFKAAMLACGFIYPEV